MKTIIEKIEKKINSQGKWAYYIKFEVLGVKRHTMITKGILSYLGIKNLKIDDEIEVIKNISSKGKEFYRIVKKY